MKNRWEIYMFAVTVFLLVATAWLSIPSQNPGEPAEPGKYDKCKLAGGVPIRYSNTYVCINDDAIIKLK